MISVADFYHSFSKVSRTKTVLVLVCVLAELGGAQ